MESKYDMIHVIKDFSNTPDFDLVHFLRGMVDEGFAQAGVNERLAAISELAPLEVLEYVVNEIMIPWSKGYYFEAQFNPFQTFEYISEYLSKVFSGDMTEGLMIQVSKQAGDYWTLQTGFFPESFERKGLSTDTYVSLAASMFTTVATYQEKKHGEANPIFNTLSENTRNIVDGLNKARELYNLDKPDLPRYGAHLL